MKRILFAVTFCLACTFVFAQNESKISLRTVTRGVPDALIVIDDVVYDSVQISKEGNVIEPLSTINADDVETVEVLKNESAIAIYGKRAKNGVIIITTKRGKAKQDNVKKIQKG